MKLITQKITLFIYIYVVFIMSENIFAGGGGGRNIILEVCTKSSEKTAVSEKKEQRINRPNVLLIGVETLRADHVSCLGYSRNTTPTLDELAEEGVLFTRAIATSGWTVPSVMSVLTSLYPGIHKTTSSVNRVPEEIHTLAEILKENNYQTAAFISNPSMDKNLGFRDGFDLYDDFSVGMVIDLDIFGNEEKVDWHLGRSMTSKAISNAATNWLKNNREQPFFMFAFFFDPHYDYTPPAPFDRVFDPNYMGFVDGRGITSIQTEPARRDLEHIKALYDGEILYTDGYISKLLDSFREYGILDETLVVVFGDHGDEFFEHGSMAHGHSLYNELIHVPLILRRPGIIPRDREVGALVSQVDIMPTILDYLGIEYSDFMQGGSLKSVIEGHKESLHDIVFAELGAVKDKILAAAISEKLKFILDLRTGDKELFDLEADPNEQVNIYKEKLSADAGKIAIESELNLMLDDNRTKSKKFFGDNLHKVEPDEGQLKALKALGYLQ